MKIGNKQFTFEDMKAVLITCMMIIIHQSLYSQVNDTLQLLKGVTVRAFEQPASTPGSGIVKIIINADADRTNKTSLVNSFNSLAGVRMEERSPGSYRINIRGSSLRSPFGVRNVKVYWNDIPVTDAGGNTYFNQFAFNNFSHIEVVKGPASSLYGAGTGGLITLHNFDYWKPGVSLEYVAGSYDLQNLFTSLSFGDDSHKNIITYAHNENDGYRVQSSMRRDNASWSSRIKISSRQQLTASLLYTDMEYQTPGALTLAEYNNDAKAARPAGGGFPSAVNAKATIYQQNLLAGFTSDYRIADNFSNSTSLFGAYARIKNAAIRNYERRTEPQFGGRSTFKFERDKGSQTFQLIGGGELQQGYFNSQVAQNRNGRPDTIQTNDDISQLTYSFFVQGDYALNKKIFITAGASLNKSQIAISRLNKYPVIAQKRDYNNEVAPRVAIRYNVSENLGLMALASKGFSPPTTAEVLPSTGVISTDLNAEKGWNYEVSVQQKLINKSLNLEVTAFYFKLMDALVQRRDISGADFFVNAGEVKEKGLEISADYVYASLAGGWIDYMMIKSAYTLNHFRYGSFIKGVDNFSGREVPSVPASSFSALADINFVKGFYLNTTLYTASRIYLNDANTASADGYELLGARIGWHKKTASRFDLRIYAGAENLFNQKYSLGNDINAAANRFYNVAPRRNYYTGLAMELAHKKKLPE